MKFPSEGTALPLQAGTFHIAWWGCQMNVYDAGRIRDLMQAAGYAECSGPQGAEVVVLVTCAIRAKAEDKVFSQIGAWRKAGALRRGTIVALGGCVGEELAAAIPAMEPAVSIVFGPQTAHRLPELIGRFRAEGRPVVEVGGDALEKFSALPPPGRQGPSAFVTIMEGCAHNCSYCIVPQTRGGEVSRPVADILQEARAHLDMGAREIHLLGQNVNGYRGPDRDGSLLPFSGLLYEIAALQGVERIRFTTSNPMEFGDDLVQALRDVDIIASSIHIPVQSGSDRILQGMNRRYTAAGYRRLAEQLRAVRPDVCISTDFIVGFPGETDDDFAATLRLVDDIGFDQSFSFIYSPRPGTPAAALEDHTPAAVKSERLHVLQQHLETHAARHAQAMVGTRQRVLVEGTARRDAGMLRGRTSSNRIVVFQGDAALVGAMADVQIRGCAGHTLKGELS